MIYIVAVLIVLGPLVFVHELGHYLAAKFFGVRVEVFSLGFGKRLVGFYRGGTDYRLSALPFGGYVRMKGENPMEEHAGDPDEFMSHPRWQRFFIAIAGPVMNALFAIALLTGLYMFHYPDQSYLKEAPVVGWVQPGSMAARVGLAPGDRITRIDGKNISDWGDLYDQLSLLGPRAVPVYFQRGSETLQGQMSAPMAKGPAADLGIGPNERLVVDMVEGSSPGASAGIKAGDELLKIDGNDVHAQAQISAMINNFQKAKEQPVALTFIRDGRSFEVRVTPRQTPQGYRIGVAFAPLYHIRQLSFPAAVSASLAENGKNSFLIVEILKRLVERRVSIKQFAGPVGIAQISGEALRAGWPMFIYIMALISLNLGIFNLLPIPILDGGLILLLAIEGALRRDIKREVKEMVYQAAFVFIVLFAAVVIYNDVAKIVAQ